MSGMFESKPHTFHSPLRIALFLVLFRRDLVQYLPANEVPAVNRKRRSQGPSIPPIAMETPSPIMTKRSRMDMDDGSSPLSSKRSREEMEGPSGDTSAAKKAKV